MHLECHDKKIVTKSKPIKCFTAQNKIFMIHIRAISIGNNRIAHHSAIRIVFLDVLMRQFKQLL